MGLLGGQRGLAPGQGPRTGRRQHLWWEVIQLHFVRVTFKGPVILPRGEAVRISGAKERNALEIWVSLIRGGN